MSAITNESNLELRLKRVPEGEAGPEDFEVHEASVTEPARGEVLVRNHYIAVDAALRLIVRESDEFLFRVRPGDAIRGVAAGEVIASRHPNFAVGDLVAGALGVQRFAVSNGEGLEKCDTNQVPLSGWLGGFGVPGLTAYFALFDQCRPQPNQTVVINGAAGAVGTMAGQLAKLTGARVIGITGSEAKCRWLVDELDFDAAINYRQASWPERLAEAAPRRVDVIFDNVGGDVLNDSLPLIAMHGIVLLCGSTSQYSASQIQGPSNYIWLATMRARLQGFVIFDYAQHYGQARAHLADWLGAGRIRLCEDCFDGDVSDFPEAFQALFRGRNKGKMLLRLPGAPR